MSFAPIFVGRLFSPNPTTASPGVLGRPISPNPNYRSPFLASTI
ncbi:hypothetical protein NON20_11775 [Synechocystis sp. B12]|nr:hypothetical protein NON20_11775 [Synechocystis sp. B12]